MPRPLRQIQAGIIYHVLNRGNARQMLFRKPADFQAFCKVLAEALGRFPVDLLAFCLMGNHWHLLLRPRAGGALSQMMGWMTVTHARRHHQHYSLGGHLYQGRFKSFPVQSDEHFLTVARYIHANPLRAKLCQRAQDWLWSDLNAELARQVPLKDWPVDRPRNWLAVVNEPQNASEQQQVVQSIRRGVPFGSAQWTKRMARELGLQNTLRPRGRPKKPRQSLHPKYRRELERAERASAEKSG
jgi:putative transposase